MGVPPEGKSCVSKLRIGSGRKHEHKAHSRNPLDGSEEKGIRLATPGSARYLGCNLPKTPSSAVKEGRKHGAVPTHWDLPWGSRANVWVCFAHYTRA
ncbi:hypothetical protein KUCAC02_002756 [Chaenocephalus aceratus]|uniref:Uncharacterized protein n=1 Tax=Chaenocephalus aceratus TaxID=36190 RepID=A0ACB9XUI3_CHAAC|nr:hypothetical protein KUCAC02_002756 [Chaenocephalus aceratus]